MTTIARSRLRIALVSLLAPFAASLACDSEDSPTLVEEATAGSEIADVYCSQLFSCSCEDGQYADELDCRQRIEQMWGNIGNEWGTPETLDLTWDPACAGRMLDEVEDRGCGGSSEEAECGEFCAFYYGSKRAGEACENYYTDTLSDCVQGLSCIRGECADPCDASFGAGVGQSCDEGCQEDLVCDPDSFTCRLTPGLGEACPQNQCTEGTFCDSSDVPTCVGLLADGGACSGHNQCQSLHCPRGACEPRPEKGQSCLADICAEGLECRDDVCVTAEAAICDEYGLPGW